MQKASQRVVKKQLRAALLKTRQAIAPAAWQQASQQICQHLQQSSWLKQPQTILAYSSLRQEPDLSALLPPSGTAYRWGLPRCLGQDLSWHLWHPDWPLQSGRYGILEPSPDAPPIEASEVGLILVPAVACDRQGYRLGYGGGFYDRMLSQPAWAKIPTVGIVFEFALLPQLPVEPWDCRLQAICTEAGLFVPQDESCT